MRADQERVKKLLVDTVTLLCKNGLFYQEELRVEGLLGVTLDNSDVFFVHISQKLMSGEEPRDDVLLPSDLTLAPTNSHGDMKDDAAEITSNNKMHVQECHDNRIVIRPMEERGQHSRSVSPSRYQQSSRSSIHSEDSNSMVDGQDLRRGSKRDQEEEEEAMESVKYLRRPDPSSRVPMPQDDSELVHPQAPGEAMHPTFSQFDQLIAAANQASSGETGGGKRRSYGGGEPGAHAPPPSGAFVTGIARAIHGDAANAQGPGGAGGGGGSGPNEWPNSTSAIEMAAHLAQSQNPGQLSVDTSALASTSSWPNTPISSAGQGPSMGQFGSADMLMYGSLGYLASAMEQHGKLTVSPAPQVAIVSEVVTPPPVVATVPNVSSCPKPSAKKRRPKAHHQPAATGSSSNTKNRRSWLTKGKPYVCSYPGCRRSYFYQHDVKRHYKQQHSSGPEDQLLLGDRQTKT